MTDHPFDRALEELIASPACPDCGGGVWLGEGAGGRHVAAISHREWCRQLVDPDAVEYVDGVAP